MGSITEFIGHFHPVLVHLPIGILLLAGLLQFLSRKKKYQSLQQATGIALLAGMISAVITCISGFLLAQSGEYDAALAGRHQWLGIGTAVVSVAAYYLHKRNNPLTQWAMLLLVVLIIITGHLGGTLTHGAGYLTSAFTTGGQSTGAMERKPITNVQEAVLYKDIIQPVLQEKCYSCHGAAKQKGKLRLDTPEFITIGGKNGKTLVAGKADESNLIKKIGLPPGNEGHMPPKEKPQLTKEEIDLLRWWISSGASFDKKVKDLPQPAKIKVVLTSLQSGNAKEQPSPSFIPDTPVEKADTAIIAQLKKRGIAVVPVAQNSNYLSASFIAVDTVTAKDIAALIPVSRQLIWLKLGNTRVTDAALHELDKLTALTRLSLERTAITDESTERIKSLTLLQYLNLSGTAVSSRGLALLTGLKKLQYLYIYGIAITADEFNRLAKNLPATRIDTGGYKVPVLASDTTLVKAKSE
jgi:uncharacterized membrane protein/mono/diheme cytochrome c family protein